MQTTSLLAQAGETGDGDAILGFLMIIGIIWFFCWLCNRPKSYTFQSRTTGEIRRK